jgi:hypothetical protein
MRKREDSNLITTNHKDGRKEKKEKRMYKITKQLTK